MTQRFCEHCLTRIYRRGWRVGDHLYCGVCKPAYARPVDLKFPDGSYYDRHGNLRDFRGERW